jgi:hypothetical protein
MAGVASLANRLRTSEIGGSIGKLSGRVAPSFFIVARTSRPTLGLENVDAHALSLSNLTSRLNAADITVRQRRRKGGPRPVPDSSL